MHSTKIAVFHDDANTEFSDSKEFGGSVFTQLEGAFVWVKGHYELVNRICGLLLVVVGVLMATGRLGTWMALLAA